MMTGNAADRAGWRHAFEWLNIIVLVGGLRDEFLNHVKKAITQLPAKQRTWEHIKETAAVQQDHESNRRTRSNSFRKRGLVNYIGPRGRSNSPSNKRGRGGSGGGSGEVASRRGGKNKQQMEALLRKKTVHSALQKMMFHTTSLAVRRVCATVKDWLHLFRGGLEAHTADPAGGRSGTCLSAQPWAPSWGNPVERDFRLGVRHYGDGRYREAPGGHGRPPQLHGGVCGKDMDRVRQRVPHPGGDHRVGVAHCQLRHGHLETGQWSPSYAAIAHRRGTPPHLDKVDEGVARTLPFGEEVLSELPASYRLEDGTLFLHLHLPLLDQAYHLYNLHDFPVSGPLGKLSFFTLPMPALCLFPMTQGQGRMRSWIRRH